MERTKNSFESDRKWCAACDAYVPYLMSISTSYCAECGGEVRLFNKEDWEAFSETMSARRARPSGRRKKATPAPKKRDSA